MVSREERLLVFHEDDHTRVTAVDLPCGIDGLHHGEVFGQSSVDVVTWKQYSWRCCSGGFHDNEDSEGVVQDPCGLLEEVPCA